MNTLAKVQNRKQHAKWLNLLRKMIHLFPESGPKTSAGAFLIELVDRVEEYEKIHWPIPAPKKKRKG